MPTAASLSRNCRWISGSTAGTAGTVTRSAAPANQRMASRDSGDRTGTAARSCMSEPSII
jgi:hypothetical protein